METGASCANAVQSNGFEVVRGLIEPAGAVAHLRMLLAQGKGDPDKFVKGSRVFYKDPHFETLLRQLVPKVEERVGCAVFKTYSFARQYDPGQMLAPHRDRGACEISISICLDQQGSPWPLWLLDKTGTPRSIELSPGDGLIYKGTEVLHWRRKNVHGPMSQLFLHYVAQNGPFAVHRDDRRKGTSYSVRLFGKVFTLGIRPAYRRSSPAISAWLRGERPAAASARRAGS